MPAESVARRAGAFLRSILPAEPAHWLMLVGSTLLYISANLYWWFGHTQYHAESSRSKGFVLLISWLLVVAGAAGYYLSLVRRDTGSYFPYYFVFVPAVVALTAMIGLGALWFLGPDGAVSVIDKTMDSVYFLHQGTLKDFAMDFGVGFWIAGLGLVLIAVFFRLLCLGRATLPVHLSVPRLQTVSEADEVDNQIRTMLCVWMTISLVPLAAFVGNVPWALLFRIASTSWVNSHLNYLAVLNELTRSLPVLLLIVFAMGKDAKETLRKSLRLPHAAYLGIGIVIPGVLAAIWPAANFVYDRIHWAAYQFGMFGPPQLTSYLGLPSFVLLWAVVPALVEEIAWRGFLQPRFIRRYGIARGIFFVGLVWGAFHFSGDFHANMTAGVVVAKFARRLCLTVAQSYALGWLTVRSKSVLPAALAHGFYNILLQIPVHAPYWLNPPLWAACAWFLFRYFPVEAADREIAPSPGSTLEPAT